MSSDELHTVVEPYEVVPKSLILEAYRFHAAPETFEDTFKVCRLHPAYSHLLKNTRMRSRGGSSVQWLKGNWLSAIRSWIPGCLGMKLVWNSATDGLNNATWRGKCQGSPCFVVVKTNGGYVLGGYTEVGFGNGSSYNYKTDPKAFLFSLSNGTPKRKPTKCMK